MTPKKNKKNNSYGHTFGVTPYPDWAHPTTEECYEVNRLLGELHGVVVAPKEIPKAKLNVTGCGEVPHVLGTYTITTKNVFLSGPNQPSRCSHPHTLVCQHESREFEGSF